MQSQIKYLKVLLYVCKLRFRRYSAHYFPVYLILKIVGHAKYQCSIRKLDYKFIPLPSLYFDFLCKDHKIKSEHTIFVNQRVFESYIYQKEVNFVNVAVSAQMKEIQKPTKSEKVMQNILSKSATTNFTGNGTTSKQSALYQVFGFQNVPINKIFIKENSLHNFVDKHKLNEKGSTNEVFVNLQMLSSSQPLPPVITKANIFLINTPYDLPNPVIDAILGSFFSKPQYLFRNHTYVIHLNEDTLGSFVYCENFNIFSQLPKLYFKCVHLESEANKFDMHGIVIKSLTSLHQTTSINYFVPKQLMDSHFVVSSFPSGLQKYYHDLKNSFLTFINSSEDTKKFMSDHKILPLFQVMGDRGCGKRLIVKAVGDALGIQIYHAQCVDIMTSIASQTEAKLLQVLHRAKNCQPIIICFHDFELFGINIEGHEDDRIVNFFVEEIEKLFSNHTFEYPILVVALVNGHNNQPNTAKINSLFLESILIEQPAKEDRLKTLLWLHQREKLDRKCYEIKNGKLENYVDFRVHEIAQNDRKILEKAAEQTQGFIHGDLVLLYERFVGGMKGFKLDAEFCENHLIILKKSLSDELGTPDIPKVLWEDIGGLAKLKTEIQNSIGLPLKYSHLMGKNMKRSGILLFGPPGTGKTLIAKAVATECNLSFLSVQGPELLNMYVGQSEQNVREVFSRARAAAPCVIFLDELDSLAPNRGVSGDSGGVMDRVVSQLLSEMDGIDNDPLKPIFILAATNRPDLIDPALLRPGRFDKMLYVGPCTTADEKIMVLKTQTKKLIMKEGLTLEKIVELIPMDVTGADLYSVCSNAWLSAVRRQIEMFERKKVQVKDMISENLVVSLEDFKNSLKIFVPSLIQTDMAYFNSLKANYS